MSPYVSLRNKVLQWNHEHFRIWNLSVSELWVSCFRHELRHSSTLFPTTRWWLYPWHEPSTVSIKPEAKQHFAGYYFKRGDPSYKKPIIVKNTQKSTMWAARVFTSWAKEQNKRSDQECPIEVFSTSDTTELCHWLCVFVKKARHNNGQPYTLRSLTQLLSGIQRFVDSEIYTTPESAYSFL